LLEGLDACRGQHNKSAEQHGEEGTTAHGTRHTAEQHGEEGTTAQQRRLGLAGEEGAPRKARTKQRCAMAASRPQAKSDAPSAPNSFREAFLAEGLATRTTSRDAPVRRLSRTTVLATGTADPDAAASTGSDADAGPADAANCSSLDA